MGWHARPEHWWRIIWCKHWWRHVWPTSWWWWHVRAEHWWWNVRTRLWWWSFWWWWRIIWQIAMIKPIGELITLKFWECQKVDAESEGPAFRDVGQQLALRKI